MTVSTKSTLQYNPNSNSCYRHWKVFVNDGEHEFEEWLELNNGCLCCTVKDSDVEAIEKLMKCKGNFDGILLETSGIADPGPIAKIF